MQWNPLQGHAHGVRRLFLAHLLCGERPSFAARLHRRYIERMSHICTSCGRPYSTKGRKTKGRCRPCVSRSSWHGRPQPVREAPKEVECVCGATFLPRSSRHRWCGQCEEGRLRTQFFAKRKDASKRGLSFELTEAQFVSLKEAPCFYCGRTSPKHPTIDRFDNKKGYTAENSVPACWHCNSFKGARTAEDMVERAKRIVALHG